MSPMSTGDPVPADESGGWAGLGDGIPHLLQPALITSVYWAPAVLHALGWWTVKMQGQIRQVLALEEPLQPKGKQRGHQRFASAWVLRTWRRGCLWQEASGKVRGDHA